MNLVVDIGNSRIKWSCEDGGLWRPSCSVPMRDTLETILDQYWGAMDQPQRVLVSNVAGRRREDAVHTWVGQRWRIEPEFFRSGPQCKGIVNGYEQPSQLGCDRWAAVIGARSLREKGALCVVDCGTAITVDALSADNRFVGGVIFSGIDLIQQSLLAGTSDISERRSDFRQVFGKSTAECVAGGSYLAAAGGVDRILTEMIAALDEPELFLTGGDAQTLIPLLNYTLRYEPDLVLRGLAYALG